MISLSASGRLPLLAPRFMYGAPVPAGRRPGLSRQADTAHRSFQRGRRRRHGGAQPGRRGAGAAGAARGRGQQGGRQRRDRLGRREAGRARWLHAAAGTDRVAGAAARLAAQDHALHGGRFHVHRAAGAEPGGLRGASGQRLPDAGRSGERGEGQARQAELQPLRPGHGAEPGAAAAAQHAGPEAGRGGQRAVQGATRWRWRC